MSKKQKPYFFRTATADKILFLILSTCLFGCREKPVKTDNKNKELVELQKALNTYNFKNETPGTLASLENLANRTSGDVSIQAHYFSARGYLDWFLSAAITGDKWLFSQLVKTIGISSDCKPESGEQAEIIKSLSTTCRKALSTALYRKFASAAKKEGSSGAYVTLASEAKTLTDWLILAPSQKNEDLHGSMFRLLDTRGPMGTRARLAVMYHFASVSDEILKRDETTAAFALARLLPFSCPQVFENLLGLSSPAAIYSLLRKSACGYMCEALNPASSPDFFVKTAIEKCDFKKLGYNDPRDLNFHSIHASTAIRVLEPLARILKGIPEAFSDPLIRTHRNHVEKHMALISGFRIPLPIPGSVKMEDQWITPPKIEITHTPTTHSSPILAFVRKTGLSIATQPLAGLHKRVPRIIDSEKEVISIPGRFFPSYPPEDEALVKKVRTARSLIAGRFFWKPGASERIAVYMNGDDAAILLTPQIARLTKAQFKSIEIVYLSKLSISPPALEVLLKKPQKKALTPESFLKQKKKTGSADDPEPVHLIVEPFPKETLKAFLTRLLRIKVNYPEVVFYWNLL